MQPNQPLVGQLQPGQSNSDNGDAKRDHLYRSGVGILIMNKEKKIFVGKRIDNHSDAWQMPQGGIDANENEEKKNSGDFCWYLDLGEIDIDLINGCFYYCGVRFWKGG